MRMAQDMQMMKKKMDLMMNALRGRVSTSLDDLVHRIDSPITTEVTFPVLVKFQMPQVEIYDGSRDPLNHLESFKTLMHLQRALNEIICKAFPTALKGPARVWFSKLTLKGSVRVWFSKLTPNTVSIFKELSGHFVTHFIGGQRHRWSSVAIVYIKQWEDESLRSYMTHFNKKAFLIDEANGKVLVIAFTSGLK